MWKGISFQELLKASGLQSPALDLLVQDLCYDSRLIKPGDLFFAIKGAHSDAHDFLIDAAEKGAVAAVVERPVEAPLPQVQVPSVPKAMSAVSNAFFGQPSTRLPVIGITGTNGKTTTTFLIEDILGSAGKPCSVMGTVNYRMGDRSWPAPNTTPMSMDVHRFLADSIEQGIHAAVMEVSSHALVLNRVDHVRFAVAVFTNLTQDHLDFHKDMEDYFNAKARLFRGGQDVRRVINVDDPYGQRLAREFPGSLEFGFEKTANVRATDAVFNLQGIRFQLKTPSGKVHAIRNNLLGRHNIYNCLAAAGASLALGIPEEAVVNGLNQNHGVPGRLERVEAGQDFVVAVDYAHTHDALAQVLSTLRLTGPRKLYCVFGAGGDRDRGKRPKMGRVAVEMADWAFVTSDNPRSEEPHSILKEIESGIQQAGKSNYTLIENREEAIREAISHCRKGDILLIAGKGHETYQIYGNKRLHFSDVEAARRILSQ